VTGARQSVSQTEFPIWQISQTATIYQITNDSHKDLLLETRKNPFAALPSIMELGAAAKSWND
jgi:hypothetical protein